MQTPLKFASLFLTTLMLFSIAAALVGHPVEEIAPLELEEVQEPSKAPSPGHVVFSQYISSDNCPHCYKAGGGSASHHNLKGSNGDEYVYITYMSASYGDTDTARAGNTGPYNWPWTASGAPIAYFGDRTDSANTVSGSGSAGTTYDSTFSAGGGMHSTVNDYSMSASISPNSQGTFDIDISYTYVGTGTAPSNMNLYAAILEEDCTTHTYNSGGGSNLAHGYHCWMGWLTSGNTYKSASGGSGNAFVQVSPSSTTQTQSWSSVPTSLIQGGTGNAMVVGVLMSGSSVSLGGSSPHVYHAVDSTMGPKMDIATQNLAVAPCCSSDGSYKHGDTIDLSVDVRNIGDLEYNSGGNVEFYYLNGGNKVTIDTQSLPTLSTTGPSQTSTFNTQFDTSVLQTNAWKAYIGARLTGITGDNVLGNNDVQTSIDANRIPTSFNPQVNINEVERGEEFTVLARASHNDNVDTTDTTTFEVEMSKAGQNQWDQGIVSGGDAVVYQGSSNEGREYTVLTTIDMEEGYYDIRTRAVDSRGQTSDWTTVSGSNSVKLINARPTVVAEPVPTVTCDIESTISLEGHVSDKETPLSDLTISSDASEFISWNPTTKEITVLFAWDEIQGCPLGQNGIEITVDDGSDYSSSFMPYGTLLFNVIENGQPRWQGLPTQTIDEGSSGILSLFPFVTDTDDEGNSISSDQLTLSVLSNSNPEIITVDLTVDELYFEAVDDDINGETTVTLRASDGEQYADQTIIVKINPINDAPRLDTTDIDVISIKRGKQMVIDLGSRVSDVDDPANEAFITVTPSVAGAASFNPIDGIMTVKFDDLGEQSITVAAVDRYDTNVYTLIVNVYDAKPFVVDSEGGDSGYMAVNLEDYLVGDSPTAYMFLQDGVPEFTSIATEWQMCESQTGVCLDLVQENLDITKTSWAYELEFPSREFGLKLLDDVKLTGITAVDNTGEEYKLTEPIYWRVDTFPPSPSEMTNEELGEYIEELLLEIETLESQIAESSGDTTSAEEELVNLNVELDAACAEDRYDCPVEDTNSETEQSEGFNMNIVYIVLALMIIGLLMGVLFTRGSRSSGEEDVKWNVDTLPAMDQTANSMYGGAQEIFHQPVAQQPVAQIQPVAQTQPVAHSQPTVAPVTQPAYVAPIQPQGPPLPATGLPPGWSMEQWAYYGQQYLDSLQ